jgi:hypothetical protein
LAKTAGECLSKRSGKERPMNIKDEAPTKNKNQFDKHFMKRFFIILFNFLSLLQSDFD